MSHLLLDFDKAGAEWVVTAYLANDPRMIEVCETGKSPHLMTGQLISGAPEEFVLREHKLVGSNTDPEVISQLRAQLGLMPPGIFLPRVMSIRQAGKKSNHGLNYRMGYRRFGLENELEEAEAKRIRELYITRAYPNLQLWWHAIEVELKMNNRTLENCFGRRRRFMDSWGPDLFEKATAFKPQSTVGDIVNQGMNDAFEDTSIEHSFAELLANVHDSLAYQYPTNRWIECAAFVCDMAFNKLNPTLCYSQREFTIGTDLKIGKHWGEGMISVKLENNPEVMEQRLQEAWEKVNHGTSGTA